MFRLAELPTNFPTGNAEFFNVFNHAQFENPLGNVNAATFGQVTSARDPKIGQIAIKATF
jgi:hypothetical protein